MLGPLPITVIGGEVGGGGDKSRLSELDERRSPSGEGMFGRKLSNESSWEVDADASCAERSKCPVKHQQLLCRGFISSSGVRGGL